MGLTVIHGIAQSLCVEWRDRSSKAHILRLRHPPVVPKEQRQGAMRLYSAFLSYPLTRLSCVGSAQLQGGLDGWEGCTRGSPRR